MPKVETSDPRRKARIAALQSLFAADITGDGGKVSLDWLASEDMLGTETLDFAQVLVGGVTDSRLRLDSIIQRYAPAWPVDQLPCVDRNILRIAMFEMFYTPKVPRKTAINEAVELAKGFGSESSTRFINGVLGSVMAGLESGELDIKNTTPEGR